MRKSKISKRLLAFLLAALLVCTGFPVTAAAGEIPAGGVKNSENHAPALKGDAKQVTIKANQGTGSTSYVYFNPSDYFTDEDGDDLTYTVTKDGETVSPSGSNYRVEISGPGKQEYQIVANDGQADSPVMTLVYYGVKSTLELPENSPLQHTDNSNYVYIYDEANTTFSLPVKLEPEVDCTLTYELSQYASAEAKAAVTVNADTGEVTITKPEKEISNITIYGKYGEEYMFSMYLTIYPEKPKMTAENFELSLAENVDLRTAVAVSDAFNCWSSSDFTYEVENQEIADVASGSGHGISVTPKQLGTTKVTATHKKLSDLTTEFNVTVTGVSVSIQDTPGDSVFLKNGQETTYQMLAEGTGTEETFTWTSSDDTIASVDNTGVLTAKKEGSVYIKAESSLSTEENPLAGGLYVQVKKEGKVYLDEISFENYSVFEGDEWSTKVSAFHPAKLTYDMNIKQNNISTTNLYFTPTFEDENLNAVLSYQVSGGDYQTMELTSGKTVNISNAYMTGPNQITIAVFPKTDEENVTIYTFNITRPYYTTSAITSLSLLPNGEKAIAYPKYENQTEGTLFQEKEDGSLGSAWYSSSCYQYHAFIYGKRTDTVTLTARFQNMNQYARLLTNGETPVELVYNWATAPLQLDEDGTTVFTIEVVSEKTYMEKTAAGEDPYAAPETTYTITVENVTPLGIDAQILSAEFEQGEFYEPGFYSNVYSHKVLLPNGQATDTITFSVPDGINVYLGSVSVDNQLTPASQDEAGNNVYTEDVSGTTVTINLETVSEENPEETGVSAYSFILNQRGTKDIVPDRITEYLCLGSQYTNVSSYGMEPERTLLKTPGVLSLGNFGGYIIYQYDTPIKNDEKNPYGIDFTIYGNSFGGAGASEPGNVLVSKDGETWYQLAGSMHYSDEAVWDYSMTYTKTDTGTSFWTGSDGSSGTNYNYPLAKNYPFFTWNDENQTSMTVTGLRLSSTAKDNYGSSAALYPSFGYVDVNQSSTKDGTAGNPYTGSHASIGDGFDLDWAVDAQGMPVELDEISYIKVTTASNIYAGAIGEKSTEVATVCRTSNQAESAVGTTAAPESVKVNGTEIQKKEGADNIFTASYDAESQLEVTVDVPEGTNVYVNDTYGTDTVFEEVPQKKLLRIIVQSEEQAPYIALIELKESSKEEEAGSIDTSNLSFTDITEEEIQGYVNISFTDNGVRSETEEMEDLYRLPLGTFIKSVKVPFKKGENIPQVTLRLLNALNIDSKYSGTPEDGFYMQAIENFTLNDVYYASLGEYDAGSQSGWMVTLNNWFMDQGASAFEVENGDVIKWQYSCQWGVDIGNDWTKTSAQITGIQFAQDYGTLAPEFDEEVSNYIYTLNTDAGKIAFEALLENYSSIVRCFIDGQEITYRPMQELSVDNGSVIRILSDYPYAENETDMITILIRTQDTLNEDAAYASEVQNLIDAIDRTAADEKADAVALARMVYDSLTETQKQLVTNYDKLTTAEEELKKEEQKPEPTDIASVYTTTGNYLETLSKTNTPTVSSTGGEWLVLGLARSGREVPEGYYTNVENYVKANINEAGQLHRSKSTENSRVILALTAAGYDVTNVGGYNLLNGLSDMEYLKKQGLNGPVWALIALDSHNYDTTGNVTRDALIDYILNAQLADGGFAISGTAADPDMTAMAITALAPYYAADEKVKTAVDAALTTLSAMQAADGGYAPAGSTETTCESCAQVITALTALGISPDTDARFIKNGNSVLKALTTFASEDGGFKHTLSGSRDGMATEQGYYALVSYVRMTEGKTSLYNMIDVVIRTENPKTEEKPNPQPETVSIENAVVQLAAESYNYDGKAKEPAVVSVTVGNVGLIAGVDYDVAYINNKNIGTASVILTGKGNYTGNAVKNFTIKAKTGTSFTVGANKYKITGAKTVSFTGLKSSSTKKVTIPKTVTIGGASFNVTAVAENALKSKTKVTSVTIGANVKTIGASAFKGCSKLTKVTVGSGVTTIGKEAFQNCKKLSKITIESKVLKKVGKNAFKSIKSNASVKVPAKKLSAYKKLLKNSGLSSKAKITK